MRFRSSANGPTSQPAPDGPSEEPLRRRARRPVSLSGQVIRAGGIAVDVALLDLNYDGCGIETPTDLEPGEEIKLSVIGRGLIDAEVRWFKDGRAGLRFASEQASEEVPRNADRTPVTSEVKMRRLGQNNYNVRMFDLSPSGCRVEVVERPKNGERVTIKFEGLEAIVAEVCWIDEFIVGLQFERPLHPAVFDLLLTRLQ